ncbi:MAG: hypothetical protein JOZ81_34455 [Chloroflexi bacterium]|nr:hypothetical protein [Chloroflexota bacterium]
MVNHLSFDALSGLIERRAPPIEEAKARRHLASCGRCRSELAWLERIHSMPRGAVSSPDDPFELRFREVPIQRPPNVSRLDDNSADRRRGSREIASFWISRPGSTESKSVSTH